MVGDYRKLSKHNGLKREPEAGARVKLFKGKGGWLIALIAAVGTALTIQGQVSHAATNDVAAPQTVAAAPAHQTDAAYNPETAASKASAGNTTPSVKNTAGQTSAVDTPQTATVTYIDDTTGQTLGSTDTLTGTAGSTATYSSASRIQTYENEGYSLVSDGTANGIVFDSDSTKDQPFSVHLAHKVVSVTPDDPHDVAASDFSANAIRTINYVKASDGSWLGTKTQTMKFSRTGNEDLVTKNVTWPKWNAAAIDAVPSMDIPGYTPDIATVPASTLMPGDNTTVTVKYYSTTQTATVTYKDDTTKQTLGAVDTVTGLAGSTSSYSTAARIAGYEAQGYTLVSDDAANGIVFDTDATKDQAFIVHLAHKTVLVTTKDPYDATPSDFTATAIRTINYVKASDGTSLGAKTQTETFTRTGSEDLVTKKITWPAWSPATVDAVPSLVIAGYTPDQATVPATTLLPGDQNVVTVKYSIATQKATVIYKDDTTNKTLGDDDTITGLADTTASYSTAARIKTYEQQGYKLVSDETSQGLVFDHDDTKDQVYTVHLAHATETVTPAAPGDADPTKLTAKVTRTILYQKASDNSTVSATVVQTATFTRTGTEDLVTKAVTYNNDWHSTDAHVAAVNSPVVKSYTPEQKTVAAADLTVGDDQTITVKYDQEKPSDTGDVQTKAVVGQPLYAVSYVLQPVNQVGQPIGVSVTLVANPERPIDLTKVKVLADYQLIPDQHLVVPSVSGTVVPVRYSAMKAVVAQPVFAIPYTVLPVDANGNAIGRPVELIGHPGMSFGPASLAAIPGYTLIAGQNFAVPTAAGATVLVRYRPTAMVPTQEKPAHSLNSSITGSDQQPESQAILAPMANTPGKAKSTMAPKAFQQALPQTGEARYAGVTLFGAALLGLLGYAGRKTRRKEML